MRLGNDANVFIGSCTANNRNGLDAEQSAFAAKESQEFNNRPIMSGILRIEQRNLMEGTREDRAQLVRPRLISFGQAANIVIHLAGPVCRELCEFLGRDILHDPGDHFGNRPRIEISRIG